uniref:Disease resistance R13L4/SHOC-2-like LRR domain-containing protein n=1 Tax=Fagus sylvatica TaxID=28930 RepID=A0A2N9GMH5_FAGSY
MFSGQIPFEVSKLSQLSSLYLCCNIDLSSWNIKLLQLKELSLTSLVENLTRLENLDLGGVTIISTVPNIFANLSTLRSLYLHDCGMYGEFPRGIFKLPNLRVLDMKYNKNLTGSLPDFQNWRSPLKEMNFADTSFSGELPASMGNLGSLIAFDMWGCNLSGSIPYSIGNLTNLVYLQLSNNSLAGNIPSSIGNLIQLAFLGLYDNQLSGPIPFGLANLTQLTVLSLESNRLTGPIPFGLMNLTQLHILVLEANKLHGQCPMSSFNLKNLNILAISDNYLSGTVSICNTTSLYVLDVSNNYFSSSLPQCMHNIFHGSKLRSINLRDNKFQGLLPRSLANCTMLIAIDVSNNQFNDTFPTWLGSLPHLKLLMLRSNKFHGQILESPETNYEFPNLRILDLSYNSFTGKLPLNSFKNWNDLKLDNEHHLTYIHVETSSSVGVYHWFDTYDYSMKITNKGLDTVYHKVQEIFRAIDMSSNRFVGEIPESIGDLKGLNMLNLSNNILTGHILLLLGNLTELESLDLSLSGEIPPQLAQLTFLEWFNVSHNYLTGFVPQGKQFNTFGISSFEGNLGLCGNPLSKKCWVSDSSPPAPSISKQSQDCVGSLFEFGWKIVLVGYGFGLIIGMIIGNIVASKKYDWLMKTFGMRQQIRRNMRMKHRN